MNKFRVTLIPVEGDITLHEVEGTDGPKFDGEDGMYKLLGCNMIEITGARQGDKSYDLYIDEDGRLKDGNGINGRATQLFCEWLDHEGRATPIANIVGDAALVDMEPINE